MGAASQKLLLNHSLFSAQPQWHVGSCWSRQQAPSEPEPRQGTACSGHAASILPVPARLNTFLSAPKIPSCYSKDVKGTWSKAHNNSSVSEAVKNIFDKGTCMHS